MLKPILLIVSENVVRKFLHATEKSPLSFQTRNRGSDGLEVCDTKGPF